MPSHLSIVQSRTFDSEAGEQLYGDLSTGVESGTTSMCSAMHEPRPSRPLTGRQALSSRRWALGSTMVNGLHACVPCSQRSCIAFALSASHAIYVRELASLSYDRIDEVPKVITSRLLSARSFSTGGTMFDADVLPGTELRDWILKSFADPAVDFIDVHNAKHGCFSGRVMRA
jgi:hypothetical protein